MSKKDRLGVTPQTHRASDAFAISTQEEERKRLALELHDGVGQILTGIKFRLQSLPDRLSLRSADQADIRKLGANLDRAIAEIRRVSRNLMPPQREDMGLKPDRDAAEARNELTERERQVLALLADGLANKQVARELGISVRTAEMHREHLTRKLNIAPIASLTKYAIQHGLTPLSLDPRPL